MTKADILRNLKTGEQLVTEHYRAMSERAVRRARIAALSKGASIQCREAYREFKARQDEEKRNEGGR